VEADFRESNSTRALLNLGHTFGHALESAAGLGLLSHGEAVAWGMVRACELGLVLGITPKKRAMEIAKVITGYGYETKAPHPLVKSQELLFNAMLGDKKQTAKGLKFIVPGAQGAQVVSAENNPALKGKNGEDLIRNIISGGYPI
jgi:3-dehydroquinate synthase